MRPASWFSRVLRLNGSRNKSTRSTRLVRRSSIACFAEAMGPDHPALRGVVHLWSLDAPRTETLTVAGLEAASLMGSVSAVHLVQTLSRSDFKDRAPLWLVTRGAQPADPQGAPGLAQAPIWGIGKVIALEYPGIWGGHGGLAGAAP